MDTLTVKLSPAFTLLLLQAVPLPSPFTKTLNVTEVIFVPLTLTLPQAAPLPQAKLNVDALFEITPAPLTANSLVPDKRVIVVAEPCNSISVEKPCILVPPKFMLPPKPEICNTGLLTGRLNVKVKSP